MPGNADGRMNVVLGGRGGCGGGGNKVVGVGAEGVRGHCLFEGIGTVILIMSIYIYI